MGLLRLVREHFRRRVFLGLLVMAPFGLTLFILYKIVELAMVVLSGPTNHLLRRVLKHAAPSVLENIYRDGHFVWWVYAPALVLSVVLTMALVYMVGLMSATLIGRRYIAAGEKLLRRIPGALFCYNTIKQVTDIVSLPRSRAFQKVVAIEYPRLGIWGLAFFTGITRFPEKNQTLINVFIPTTPNPTSGFLLLLPVEQVRETALTVSQATRFIISGGVVTLEDLHTRPFPIDEYAPRQEAVSSQERRDAPGKEDEPSS